MTFIPWTDADDFLASQAQTRIPGLVNAARGGLCNVWQGYSGWMRRNIPSSGAGFDLVDVFWDQVCPPPALPGYEPPNIQFTGGQCNAIYQVAISLSGDALGASPPRRDSFNSSVFVNGKVKRVITRLEPGTITDARYKFYVIHGTAVNPDANTQTQIFAINPAQYGNIRLDNVTVTRQGGQPDNCGNPPPSYPDTEPDPTVTNTNITIDASDGTDLSIPIIYAPIEFNGELNIPINIDGINFNFDLGGIEIGGNDGSGNGGFTSDDRDTITDIKDKTDAIDVKTDDIKETVEALEPCDLTPVLEAIGLLSQKVDAQTTEIDAYLAHIRTILLLLSPRTIELSEQESVIDSGVTDFDNSVVNSQVNTEGIAFILLEILGNIPPSVRVYKPTNDPTQAEIGAGNVGIALYSGGGTPAVFLPRADVFTRYTVIPIPEHFPQVFTIRTSLKAGFTWRLIDMGYRWVARAVPAPPAQT